MIYKKHFLAKYCMYLEKQITLQITLINSLPATEFPGWNPPRSSLLCKIDSECPSFYFLVLSFFTRTRKRWLIEIEIFLQQSLTYKESAWTEIKSISWHSISSSQGINPSTNSNLTGRHTHSFLFLIKFMDILSQIWILSLQNC